MAPLLAEVSPQDLLVALAELHSHVIGYMKSMALKCAVDLGIPDVVLRRGGAATLADIATETAVHPAKVVDLQRLMELLSTTGMFTVADTSGTVVYKLTTAWRLLLGTLNLSPMVPVLVSPPVVSSFFSMGDWLKSEPAAAGSLFELAHGCSIFEMTKSDATLNRMLNDCMAADSKLFVQLIILDKDHIFRGFSSLVDVIASAFPRIKCTVLDLPQVISQSVTGDGKVHFITGDMFESIPPANAVFLKNVLHDWDDKDCVKILQRCKEAIPSRNAGGKVIIMDMVIGSTTGNEKISEMEALRNLYMMHASGVERGENEWKKIFSEAGFSNDYKIMPVMGPYSVIEIYP
ncbi:hypothetical protein EJB05_28865, partial [Eragrostis curvula]